MKYGNCSVRIEGGEVEGLYIQQGSSPDNVEIWVGHSQIIVAHGDPQEFLDQDADAWLFGNFDVAEDGDHIEGRKIIQGASPDDLVVRIGSTRIHISHHAKNVHQCAACATFPEPTITGKAVSVAVRKAVNSYGSGVVLDTLIGALETKQKGELCPDRKRVQTRAIRIFRRALWRYMSL